MNQAEASGRTVEDALASALAQLDTSRDQVEFVVLDEGQRGKLFGRGSRDAVVRVTRLTEGEVAADPTPAPSTDTRIPHSANQPPASGFRGARTGGSRGPGRPSRGGGSYEQAVPKLTESDFHRTRGEEPEEPPPAPSRSTGRGPDHQGDRDRDRGPAPRSGPPRVTTPRPHRERTPEEYVQPDINAEEVEFAATIVDDLLRILDVPAGITIREPVTAGDGLGSVRAVIDLSGDGLGLLIGRRGDTLFAFQYLVNLIVSRRYPIRSGITIDVEHYRHRREEQVVALARRMADRVRETGSSITLEPMSPNERRLIHIALADDPELSTNSIGEGENRKVVISPK